MITTTVKRVEDETFANFLKTGEVISPDYFPKWYNFKRTIQFYDLHSFTPEVLVNCTKQNWDYQLNKLRGVRVNKFYMVVKHSMLTEKENQLVIEVAQPMLMDSGGELIIIVLED